MSDNTIDQMEDTFYEAFMQGDLEALMAVWWMDDSIECVHPFGPRLTGYKEVYSSWQEVINQSRGMAVERKRVHQHGDGDLVVHTVVEEVSWNSDDGRHSTEIMSTHVYRNTETGWRLVLRHASPSPSQEPAAEHPQMELH